MYEDPDSPESKITDTESPLEKELVNVLLIKIFGLYELRKLFAWFSLIDCWRTIFFREIFFAKLSCIFLLMSPNHLLR